MAINQQKLLGKTSTVQSANVAPQQQLIAAPADTAALQDISKSLSRILQLLTQQNTQVTNEANQERRNQETARRKKVELGLEGAFSTVKNVAQSVVAPVKGILDQIIQFFVTLFLGKALLNLIDWFANPENQSKVRSIARFLKDWWPSLIAGYILFGTGFGRAVRTLVGIAARSVLLLGGVALKLTGAIAKAIGLKKVGTALSALGGGGGGLKGMLAKLVVGGAVAAGGAVVAKNMMGGGGEQAPQLDVPEAPALPIAEAFGGGLIDFKTMLAASGGQVDSKLGILTQLFGSGGLAGLLHNAPGAVSGPKGIDKVPAMLTDGEFVMSRGAVQKFGVNTLESMNAAGGGTNRPKIVSKKIYADGGGLVDFESHRRSNPGFYENRPERVEYDKKHGPGAYDQELYRKYGTPEPGVKNTKATPIAPSGQRTPTAPNRITVNGIKIPNMASGLGPKINTTQQKSGMTPKMQAKLAEENKKSAAMDASRAKKADINKQARSEYNKILDNPDHPDYQKAWDNGPDYMKSLQAKYAAAAKPTAPAAAKPSPAAAKPTAAATQRSYGFKDSALGSLFGGPKMEARQDYAAGKGKYYSSSDQKTYGNYNDAKAAKQSRMTSMASQQRLDKLSSKGAGPKSGLGVRAKAESAAKKADFDKRGGLLGQIGRGFTSMFGSQKDIDKNTAQDKAAQARTKQAGAESIGKYYSSSDGKYYGNKEQAQKARKARLAKTSPNQKPITPTPKPAPKVVKSPAGGSGGSKGGGGGGAKPKIPQFSSGKSNSKTAKQLGIK